MGDKAELVLDARTAAENLLDAGYADYSVLAALIDHHDLTYEEAEAVLRAVLVSKR